tara:strand:- start:1129 stop:1821 length:693 start_codon:yes stop_codon:yes gene_type:complete
MVTVDKAVIAKIEKNGQHFEILVDPELALDMKKGKTVSMNNILAINDVYKDSKKGEKASPTKLEEAFGTSDVQEITKEIVNHGDIQLTTDMLRKQREEKKRQVAAYISANSINPETKAPHPIERVLNAMAEKKVNIDSRKPVTEQVDDVVKAIKELLPISFEKVKISIMVPAQYAGQAYGVLKKFGIEKSDWGNDGSLKAKIEVTASSKSDLYSALNAATNNNIMIKEDE